MSSLSLNDVISLGFCCERDGDAWLIGGATAMQISAAQCSEERALAQRPAGVTACMAPLPSAAAFRDRNLCTGSQRKWGNKGTELSTDPALQLGSGLGLTGFGFAAGIGEEAKAKSHKVSFEKDFYYFVEKIKHQVSATVETLEGFCSCQ